MLTYFSGNKSDVGITLYSCLENQLDENTLVFQISY